MAARLRKPRAKKPEEWGFGGVDAWEECLGDTIRHEAGSIPGSPPPGEPDNSLESPRDPVTSAAIEKSAHGISAQPAVIFDKLSKTLERHAAQLDGDDATNEQRLRPKVLKYLKAYATDESKLGPLLVEYRSAFKKHGKWTRVAQAIGVALKCSSRTIYRIIDQYEAPVAKIEAPTISGVQLSTFERREMNARLAIRSLLNNVSGEKKLKVLEQLLAEEAYQVWGTRKRFTITITPLPSRFTVDGRKKPNLVAIEVTAA